MIVLRRAVLWLSIPFVLSCVGMLSGCGSQGEQIPLAKVPPPPEGFDRVTPASKIPTTASPSNATERRR